ncbi:hypothetical protein AWQ21_09000 [Picosynechococcus sp. PCC 7003]|uniref:hypothetical protein n=1 Tax=Picosynechococcus sp. PCC 7003 TaxID=374981 RepID=UPI000810BDFF|nr:hypothetical protein [Picosynechococcus sp. PCC 7003]ANV84507.1 hypothetical protein AWQ21_09000 [Picosynechococcus sp. PCC 7003]
MTDSESNQILLEIRQFKTQVSGELKQLNTRLEHIETRLDRVEIGQEKADAYRQGTQWVVNLSFSLIVATTIGIILRFVLAS